MKKRDAKNPAEGLRYRPNTKFIKDILAEYICTFQLLDRRDYIAVERRHEKCKKMLDEFTVGGI